MGGRASGRSYSASQFALLNLLSSKYYRCAIMRYILGDIRNSIFQEIKDRIEENELEETIKIKENNLTFECGQNKINGIGFRKSSGDQKSKLKSLASYNSIIIEEADEVSEDDFMQLDDSIRTVKSDIKIILLLNPPDRNHWIIKRWFNLIDTDIDGFYNAELKTTSKDTTFLFGTYKENILNLNKKTVDNYEAYKRTNSDHYYNMIKGMVSEGERGRIFKKWEVVTNNDFNELPYPSFFGMDFGFSNDPTSLVEIKKHNENIWVKELIYETGLTNQALSVRMERLGICKDSEIYADSAEPKSIEELNNEGWNIRPALKGQDSIRSGIDYLSSKVVKYTEESINISKEIQNYKWALDKNKEPTNKPIDEYNHAMDAIRYAVHTKSGGIEPQIYIY